MTCECLVNGHERLRILGVQGQQDALINGLDNGPV